MGIVVIACYKPKPGGEAGLLEEAKTHLPILREQGLVTDRESIVAQAADGTIVEVFEWKSQEAIDAAHENPVVLEMWGRYDKVCTYIPIGEITEAAQLFSPFTPLDV